MPSAKKPVVKKRKKAAPKPPKITDDMFEQWFYKLDHKHFVKFRAKKFLLASTSRLRSTQS